MQILLSVSGIPHIAKTARMRTGQSQRRENYWRVEDLDSERRGLSTPESQRTEEVLRTRMQY